MQNKKIKAFWLWAALIAGTSAISAPCHSMQGQEEEEKSMRGTIKDNLNKAIELLVREIDNDPRVKELVLCVSNQNISLIKDAFVLMATRAFNLILEQASEIQEIKTNLYEIIKYFKDKDANYFVHDKRNMDRHVNLFDESIGHLLSSIKDLVSEYEENNKLNKHCVDNFNSRISNANIAMQNLRIYLSCYNFDSF
jgi:hypothetical protein